MKVERPLPRESYQSCIRSSTPLFAPLKEIRHAMSHALLRLTKLLPLTVLLPFLTAQSSISLARTYTESSSIHFNSFSLWDIFEKDLCLYTSYCHGELARGSSCLHQVAGRMPG